MPLDPPAIEITHIGGPTTRLDIGSVTIIVDPTFDPAGKEYSAGPVTLKKLSGPASIGEAMRSIDVALVSHDQHPDNLDGAGRELLKDIPLVLTTVAGAERLGHGAIGLRPWETHTIQSCDGTTLRITATPARHGPPSIEKLTGDVIGFVVSMGEANQALVYATGDTVWYEGLAEVAKRFEPRVILAFAGAARTARGPFNLTMDTNGVLELAEAFRSSMIVPVHTDGWAHFSQSAAEIEAAFRALGREDRLKLLPPGTPTMF